MEILSTIRLSAALIALVGIATVQTPQKTTVQKEAGEYATKQAPGVRNASIPGALSTVAGGSDDCTTLDPIAGQGTFAFDNSAATYGAEGQNEYACYPFGSSAVDNHVWFVWSADATGTALVETCSLTTMDSELAAYPDNAGGCPTVDSALACNDDTCGLESQISFPCAAACTYTL